MTKSSCIGIAVLLAGCGGIARDGEPFEYADQVAELGQIQQPSLAWPLIDFPPRVMPLHLCTWRGSSLPAADYPALRNIVINAVLGTWGKVPGVTLTDAGSTCDEGRAHRSRQR